MKFKINLSYNPIDGNKIAKTLESYTDRHHNDIITDFEDQIKTFTGSKYVVALNTGTAALHLALKALGVNQGDYVLVSTFTYVASVNPILYLGAIPYFIDSEMETWNMDPALLEEAINKLSSRSIRPKAIILVHAYGIPAQIDEIRSIANRYEIPILEDSAEAIGSYYKQKHVGCFGEIGTLSFNTNKLVTTYGGGAILTENLEHYQKIQFWATQSREVKPYYEHHEVGFNYRMSPIIAAVGLSEWADIPVKLMERKAILEAYQSALQNRSGFTFPKGNDDSQPNNWFSTILINQNNTKGNLGNHEVMQKLAEQGIEARLMWNPMHKQPVFQQYESIVNGVSEQLFALGLCLPSDHRALIEQDIIIKTLQEF